MGGGNIVTLTGSFKGKDKVMTLELLCRSWSDPQGSLFTLGAWLASLLPLQDFMLLTAVEIQDSGTTDVLFCSHSLSSDLALGHLSWSS